LNKKDQTEAYMFEKCDKEDDAIQEKIDAMN